MVPDGGAKGGWIKGVAVGLIALVSWDGRAQSAPKGDGTSDHYQASGTNKSGTDKVPFVVRISGAPTSQQQAADHAADVHRHDTDQAWIIGIGIAAIFAAIAQAAVLVWQIFYLRRTLAHETNASEQELRAYVFVHRTEMERGKKITKRSGQINIAYETVRRLTGRVSYSIENTGKTPAKNVEIAVQSAWIKTGTFLDFTNVGDFRLIGPLGPRAIFNADINPQGPGFIPTDIPSIADDGKHELHLWGRIEYGDEFSEERRWTTFHCQIGGAVGYDRTMHTVEPGNDYR